MRTSDPLIRKRDQAKRPPSNAGTCRAENRNANPETRPNPAQRTVPRPSPATRRATDERVAVGGPRETNPPVGAIGTGLQRASLVVLVGLVQT